jgi:hypothetical protein
MAILLRFPPQTSECLAGRYNNNNNNNNNNNIGIDIQRMWNMKAQVIPVIIGATGTISKSLRQYLRNIPGKHEIKGLQKRPYWVLRRVLMLKYKQFFTGERTLHVAQIVNTEQ